MKISKLNKHIVQNVGWNFSQNKPLKNIFKRFTRKFTSPNVNSVKRVFEAILIYKFIIGLSMKAKEISNVVIVINTLPADNPYISM